MACPGGGMRCSASSLKMWAIKAVDPVISGHPLCETLHQVSSATFIKHFVSYIPANTGSMLYYAQKYTGTIVLMQHSHIAQ